MFVLLRDFRRLVSSLNLGSLRRGGAVVLALVLCVSVLVVVSGSPASAANTAVESLVDADGKVTTPPVRAFAGANRYATSLAIAKSYVEVPSNVGLVDAVIIASGESLIDAAAAAGLAAAKTAPVILTPSSRLPRAVQRFIDEEFITDVFIVGGTDAVSQDVEDALNAIGTVSSVERLGGVDRYATSAAVADEVNSARGYCDSGQVSAIVTNVDASFSDAIAVGPLVYSLGLPMLLTAADQLPSEVFGYLTDSEVERVVIVGDTNSISQTVVDQISDAGVTDVTRITGANRFARSVAILEAIKECSSITLNPTTVAFVNATAASDGVSAAPLLGSGDGSTVTPVLLVETTGLSPEVSGYLSSLPMRTSSGLYVDAKILAIGGTSVVPAAVVSTALRAATTSEPLTATINAKAGTQTVKITFSSPVDAIGAVRRSNYRVGRDTLLFGDSATLVDNVVTLTLRDQDRLIAGDTIAIASGRITGVGADKRRFAGTRATVRKAVSDNLRPRVNIFAPAGGNELRISVIETNLDNQTPLVDLTKIKLNNKALPSGAAAVGTRRVIGPTSTGGTAQVSNVPESRTAFPAITSGSTAKSITVCLSGTIASLSASSGSEMPFLPAVVARGEDPAKCAPTPATDALLSAGSSLAVGDKITVEADAFRDDANNANRTISATVVANKPQPRVIQATVTRPTTYVAGTGADKKAQLASWTWGSYANVPTMVDGVMGVEAALQSTYLKITAKATGVATGALGNAWFIDWFQLPTDADEVTTATVDVYVSRKTIRIGYDDDANLYTIATALAANEDVTANFTVDTPAFTNPTGAQAGGKLLPTTLVKHDDSNTATNSADNSDPVTADPSDRGSPTSDRRTLTGGSSSVTVKLLYNDILKTFVYTDNVDTDDDAGRADLIDANVGSDNYPAESNWQDAAEIAQTLVSEISFTLNSNNLAELLAAGDTINLPANVAVSYNTSCTPAPAAGECGKSVAATAFRLRAA